MCRQHNDWQTPGVAPLGLLAWRSSSRLCPRILLWQIVMKSAKSGPCPTWSTYAFYMLSLTLRTWRQGKPILLSSWLTWLIGFWGPFPGRFCPPDFCSTLWRDCRVEKNPRNWWSWPGCHLPLWLTRTGCCFSMILFFDDIVDNPLINVLAGWTSPYIDFEWYDYHQHDTKLHCAQAPQAAEQSYWQRVQLQSSILWHWEWGGVGPCYLELC